jgi:RNA polymerase sigma factor (sigma-70 family)
MTENEKLPDCDRELIPTRKSLLSRLKDRGDEQGWKLFFDTYWRLIYRGAIRAGLTDAEAQDVVQETVISVMKGIGNFEYDPEKGSFKNWLLRLTSWRITDQFRKRQRKINHRNRPDTSADTATIERIPDPAGIDWSASWDEEWERNLLVAAIDRVKRKVDPKQYQIFDLYVIKQWPVLKVVRTLNVSSGKVYLIRHRINKLLKKEIDYLRTKPI